MSNGPEALSVKPSEAKVQALLLVVLCRDLSVFGTSELEELSKAGLRPAHDKYIAYFRKYAPYFPKMAYGCFNMACFKELQVKDVKEAVLKADDDIIKAARNDFKSLILADEMWGDQNWAMNLFTSTTSKEPAIACTRAEEGKEWGQSFPGA